MTKRTRSSSRRTALKIAISIALVCLAAFALAHNWQIVTKSLELARNASWYWFVAGLLLMAGTFGIAAAIYSVIALHKLQFGQTLVIEVSTAFVNRLLPSGLGGLGLHGVYLFKKKHTPAEATVVVSVNNLVGIAAHLLLLIGVIMAVPSILRQLIDGHIGHMQWQVAGVLIVALVVIASVRRVRAKLVLFGQNILKSIRKVQFSSLVKAVLLAVCMTVTYTLILLCSARSIGVGLGILQLFIVFSIGMLASTATPTPGGLVGAEAGLYAGFISYGISPAQAGAAVLIFRLISYWLPLVPGAFALALARRQQLL